MQSPAIHWPHGVHRTLRPAFVLLIGCLMWIAGTANAQQVQQVQQLQQAQVAIPALTTQVTDTINLLDPIQRNTLETTLHDYAIRTGTQIGILLIASTAPEAIEQYGIRVADAWKLGRKGIDDGVILIVARDNPKELRRLRLEVGRGVQGTLTDAQSNRILQEVIAPHFRQNDYYGGLVAATAALQTVLDREHLPAPVRANQQAQSGAESSDLAGLLPILFVMLAGIALIGSRMRRGGNSLSSNGWGRTAGVILGSQIGSQIGRSGGFGGGGGGFGGFGGGGGGGFSGGGGFDGGGASGNW